jgi:hypothetical protein
MSETPIEGTVQDQTLPQVGDLVQLPQLPPGKYGTIVAVNLSDIEVDIGKEETIKLPMPKRFEDRLVKDSAYPPLGA